jgi:hypothetical protein
MKRQFGKLLMVVLVFGLAVSVAIAADTKTALIAFWPLDADASDIVGGNNGKLVGGAKFVTDTTSGKVLEVDGKDGHVEVPHSAKLVFTIKESYTLSAWVNVLVLPGHWSGVVDKSRDISPWYGIWIDGTNKWIAGGTNLTGSAVTATKWQHLALVQDGTANTRTLYLNGKADVKGTAIDANGAGDLWMGGAKSVSEFVNARIDEVLLYKRALTPDDVLSLMAAPFTAVEPVTKLTTTWGAIK